MSAPAAAPADALDPARRGRLFAAVAGVVVLFLAASSVPSPLYVVYQAQWGFSAATLTVVFAVYVLFLLTSLLVVGGLSDHVGRRPVLAVALVVQTVAVVLFLVADGVTTLLVARAVQGAATGAAITAMAATLVDLHPRRAGLANATTPLIGLALGALGCGLLVEYAPAPTRLVWGVLLAGFAVVAVVLALLPETAPRRTGAWASLRPRLRIPAGLRADVLAIVPTLAASWALGGLYLSLGPSVAAEILGLRSHLVGGIVVTLLCGVGALTAITVFRRPPESLLAPAGGLLALGTLVTLGGLVLASPLLTVVGTVVAGLGFGSASLACFGTLARIAAPETRGELMAVAYTIAYLAFSLPAVVAGVLTVQIGLQPVAEGYGLVVVALGVTAVVARLLVVRSRRTQEECARA
ncbi:MFS transporter [Actinomycetospora straminea]|uniref:MFS transporter n=1 Tax=Actinomycetospora straminea TaxID=663607 RepID=A0ABP9EI82_9PSEU|nr:MFS transporter [Actinomycetospora straminea]MDD7933321.1 MFS transporter [Actinomycetospora straminea]